MTAPQRAALPVRRIASFVLYGAGLAVFIVCWYFALVGGGWLSAGSFSVRISSWKILRWIALAIALGLAIDPQRTRTCSAVARFFDAHFRLVVLTGLALTALHLCLFKVTQHLAFQTSAFDFSLFHYAIHNTLEGRFLHAFGIDRNFFSEHFSPLLLALVPIYAVARSPFTLLVVQGIVSAAAAVPLFLIARHSGLGRWTALLVALVFLNHKIFWRAFVYDFHIEMFAPLMVFGAFLALLRRSWGWFYLFVILTLAIKEEMAAVALALAVAVVVVDRHAWRHALAAGALAVSWAVIAFRFIIPGSYSEPATTSHFVDRWAHLGGSYGDILLGLFANPALVARAITSEPAREIYASFWFLPILDPILLLLAAAAFLLHLASNYEVESSLGVYYALPGTTLLFIALARALGVVARAAGTRAAFATALLLFLAYPGCKWCKPVTDRDRLEARMLASIPADARVSAQSPLVPHLPPSDGVRMFPDTARAELIALDLERGSWPLEPDAYEAAVRSLLRAGRYGVVDHRDGIVFLRDGADPTQNEEVLREMRAAE
jgi:uncharacterized membrane protein